MQNTQTNKSLVSKLITLFAVVAFVTLLSVNSVFGDFGDKELPKADQTFVLLVADINDEAKVLEALKKVDGLSDVTKDDFVRSWSEENKVLTLKSVEGKKYKKGEVKLNRVDTAEAKKTADEAATKPFYKKWWFWTVVAVSLVAVGGGAYYFVKKKQA